MRNQYAIITLVAIAVLLIGSTAVVGAQVEAKSKKTTIDIYVKNIFKTKPGENQKLTVCIADDDGCHSYRSKTVKLQNGDGKHGIQKVATFKVQFSSNPKDEWSLSDSSACGKLKNALELACGPYKKTGKNSYKATIDYRDLYENNKICTDPRDGWITTCKYLD